MKKALLRIYNHLWLIAAGCIKIVIGVNLIERFNFTFEILANLLVLYFLIQFIGSSFQVVINKDKSKGSSAVTNFGLLLLFRFLPGLPFKFVLMIMGAALVLQGAAQLIQFYIEYRNKVESRFGLLSQSVFLTLIGLAMIILAWSNPKYATWVFAIYCIASGLLNFFNGVFNWIPNTSLNKFKRRIRITPPVFLDAVFPRVFLERINEKLSPKADGELDDEVGVSALERPINEYKVTTSGIETRVKVMIHVTDFSFGQVGHIDVSLDDIVYSYGSYDHETHLIGGLIGDGVFFEAPRAPYAELCKDEGKTLFVFGIQTTDDEIGKIKEEINKFKSSGYVWQSNFDKGVPIDEVEALDYASKLSHQTGATMYKFASGRYKKYFGMTTNCVLVADMLLGPTGSNMFKNTGILTPGTYLNFLYEQSKKEGSNVVSFTIDS